jgi:hypothetical protein
MKLIVAFRKVAEAPNIQHFPNKYYLHDLTGCDFQNKQRFVFPMHRKSVGFYFASRECLLYSKHWIIKFLFREIREWSAIAGHGLSLHKPRVRYRASPCAICGGQGDYATFSSTLFFPCQYHSVNSPYSSSPHYYPCMKDKRTKPWNHPTTVTLSHRLILLQHFQLITH